MNIVKTARLKDKATIAQQETICNCMFLKHVSGHMALCILIKKNKKNKKIKINMWNGTMFVDLD